MSVRSAALNPTHRSPTRHPAVGAPATYTFAFKRPASATGGEFHVDVTGMTSRNGRLSESNPRNNSPSPAVIMRTVD